MEYDHFVTQLSIEHFLSAQLGGVPVIVSDAMDQASSRTIRIRGTNTYAAKGKVEMVGAVASNAAMEVAMDAAGNIEEETLPEAPADLRTNWRKQLSSTRNSVLMSREKFPFLSLCPRV